MDGKKLHLKQRNCDKKIEALKETKATVDVCSFFQVLSPFRSQIFFYFHPLASCCMAGCTVQRWRLAPFILSKWMINWMRNICGSIKTCTHALSKHQDRFETIFFARKQFQATRHRAIFLSSFPAKSWREQMSNHNKKKPTEIESNSTNSGE